MLSHRYWRTSDSDFATRSGSTRKTPLSATRRTSLGTRICRDPYGGTASATPRKRRMAGTAVRSLRLT